MNKIEELLETASREQLVKALRRADEFIALWRTPETPHPSDMEKAAWRCTHDIKDILSEPADSKQEVPMCPKCFSKHPLVDQTCTHCGTFLGKPDAVADNFSAVLQKTLNLLLRYCGWERNYRPDGAELPMSRPRDVQEVEKLCAVILSSPSNAAGALPLNQDSPSPAPPAANIEQAISHIKNLFADYGSGDYDPTEAEKQIIDTDLRLILGSLAPPALSVAQRWGVYEHRLNQLWTLNDESGDVLATFDNPHVPNKIADAHNASVAQEEEGD